MTSRMKMWLSPAELIGLPGLPGTEFGVRKKAKSENWDRRPRTNESRRGRAGYEYPIEALPAETRLALAAQVASNDPTAVNGPGVALARAEDAGRKTKATRRTVTRVAGTAAAANVTGTRAAERDDKLRVLVCLERFRTAMGLPLCPAVQAFCEAWNAGRIEAPASALERFPTFTRWRTVLEWHQALENHGGAGITRPPSARAGQFQALEGELGQIVVALIHNYPHIGAKQIHRLAKKEVAGTPLAEQLPSVRAFQRAVNHWKSANEQLFSLVTSPDRWRSHYMAAAGSRSENVKGVNDLWEMDGTKGELMLADGKRWTVTAVIDVFSRRMMVRLSESARAAVVMGLVRSAVEGWGMPRRIKTDNGSDYVAQQFELALVQLAVQHDLCDPFQPQQKPHIERGLGTMLHDLFELLPGYLGHNVAERQDIEARRSFAQRLMKGEGGGVVELRLQPDELQALIDAWLDEYHDREHGGLGERTPNQMVADWPGVVHLADERALDIFLEPANGQGLRTVGKKGIKIDHGWFNCAEIGGLEGQQVQVKQTESDLGVCYVFDLDGRYIGTAIDHARKGISAAEVAAERREHQKKLLAQQKAELKAAVRAVKPQDLVMRALQRKTDKAIDDAENVTRLRPTAQHSSEAIDSVVQAPAPSSALSPAAAATLQRLEQAQAPAARAPVIDMTTLVGRYSRAVRLKARMAAGEPIDPADLKWLEGYVSTSEFRGQDRVHHGIDPLSAEAGG